MSNNIVWLQGYFEVDRVETVEVGRKQQPVIHAWLYTAKSWEGGRHPLLITGRPAEIVLEMSQKAAESPEVLVNGKLLSQDERSWVEVKRITFLGIPLHANGRVPE